MRPAGTPTRNHEPPTKTVEAVRPTMRTATKPSRSTHSCNTPSATSDRQEPNAPDPQPAFVHGTSSGAREEPAHAHCRVATNALQPPRSTLDTTRVPDRFHLGREQLCFDRLLMSQARTPSHRRPGQLPTIKNRRHGRAGQPPARRSHARDVPVQLDSTPRRAAPAAKEQRSHPVTHRDWRGECPLPLEP